ncbi:hypothetical protein ANN_18617 [Periplaneta americana]|uniref:Uncharacterized protein n=1 Tax=Periplaneta americana TaxID=6978 RepID=A0ABQ8SPX7_PERAM|nr:hypothetical protein ANN_18617 [Periplaneta americana]
MSLGSNTENYPAFAHIGLRENPGKNLNQVTCPDRESNPGHLVSRLDALTSEDKIAEVLRHLGWEVHEEVHCISAADSNRRADIIVIDRVKDKAMILDPTIRFERNLSQADEVNKEKQEIYEPCLPFLSSKYNILVNQWVVKYTGSARMEAATRDGGLCPPGHNRTPNCNINLADNLCFPLPAFLLPRFTNIDSQLKMTAPFKRFGEANISKTEF